MTGLLASPPPITRHPSPTQGLSWQAVVVCAVSGQRLPQRLGVLEVCRTKAFGEPVIHRGEEVISILMFALLLPESSQAGSGAEFQRPCLLRTGYTDGMLEAGFGFSLIVQMLL